MRPLEILTIILLTGSLTALLTHKQRKTYLYLLFATIVAMLIQHFYEGNRWQFAFAIYLLPASYVCHRFQENIINSITKFILIVWLGLAIIVPWAIPVFNLPNPGGQFDVGTNTFHWVDSSRLEWFTNEDQSDVRQLMVQIWYPAEKQNNNKPEPYLDFIDLRAKTLANAGNIPEFFPSHLNYISTNSYTGLPSINNDNLLPILIFSHGITGSRHLHQVMYEHLASRGYVVIAPDHSYDANITIFPNLDYADYRSDITGHPDSVNIRSMQMNTRAKDIIFIIDQVQKLFSGEIKSTLNGKINLDKIAIGGHSYGGATATLTSDLDNRIKACFVLDSWLSPIPNQTIKNGIHIPFLFMGRPTWEESDYPGNYPTLDSLMTNSSDPKYRLIIKESQHLDFSDIPLFSPIIHYVMDVGTLPAKQSTTLLNNLVYEFLEKYLMNSSDLLFNDILKNNLIYKNN